MFQSNTMSTQASQHSSVAVTIAQGMKIRRRSQAHRAVMPIAAMRKKSNPTHATSHWLTSWREGRLVAR